MEDAQFRIVDIAGKWMITGEIIKGENTINTSHLSPGTYWIELFSNGFSNRTKLIKLE
jgi:hypothetical protein